MAFPDPTSDQSPIQELPQSPKAAYEGEHEYRGRLAAIQAMHRRNGNLKTDIAAAKVAAATYDTVDARSQEGLNQFLQEVYTVHVSASVENNYDDILRDLFNGSKPRGINARTSPVGAIIKGLLGPKYQHKSKRGVVGDWALCIRTLLAEGISHFSVSEEIKRRGGYGEIVKEARKRARVEKDHVADDVAGSPEGKSGRKTSRASTPKPEIIVTDRKHLNILRDIQSGDEFKYAKLIVKLLPGGKMELCRMLHVRSPQELNRYELYEEHHYKEIEESGDPFVDDFGVKLSP